MRSQPTDTDHPRRIASKAGAAYAAGVCKRTIEKWLGQGLPHLKLSPRLVRIDLDEMSAWLKEKYGVRRLAAPTKKSTPQPQETAEVAA